LTINRRSNRWHFLRQHFVNKLEDEYSRGELSAESLKAFLKSQRTTLSKESKELIIALNILQLKEKKALIPGLNWELFFDRLIRPSDILLEALSLEKGNFAPFNEYVDDIKTQKNWKSFIFTEVQKLTSQQLLTLSGIDALLLRGYDREFFSVVFQAVKHFIDPNEKDAIEAVCQKLLDLETNVILVKEDCMVPLGAGKVNQVYSVSYFNASTGENESLVFKPDPTEGSLVTQIIEDHFGTASASGISPNLQAHLPCRAVASSIIDALLYGPHTISVKTEFAIVNGKRGITMQRATGISPKVYSLVDEAVNLDDDPKLRERIRTMIIEDGNMERAQRLLKYRKLKLTGDLDKEWSLTGTKAQFFEQCQKDLNDEPALKEYVLKNIDEKTAQLTPNALKTLCQQLGWQEDCLWYDQSVCQLQGTEKTFDPKSPRLMESLLKLQIKDIIAGECDRHPENYLVDFEQETVIGIDEDCSFGVNAFPENVDVRQQKPYATFIPNNASLMLRMPKVVTAKIKQSVEQLCTREDLLREKLRPLINPEEVNATISRLTRLNSHLNSHECLIVLDAEALFSPEALELMDSNNSYFMRELLVYDSNQKGWNHLRDHRP
jgi:hypothetical protein